MSTTEVYTREIVQTRQGQTVGRIVGVRRDGKYVGSYFEATVTIPRTQIDNCRRLGINVGYQVARERAEGKLEVEQRPFLGLGT